MQNNTRTNTVWIVIIILIIIAIIAYGISTQKSAPVAPAGTTTGASSTSTTSTTTTSTTTTGTTPTANVVDYFCTQGTIVATYGTSSVALSLSDGRTMTLPQTTSGSGIMYAEGNVTFSSEGNDAYLSENGTNTYDDCVAGTVTPSGSTSTYTDPTGLFSFNYPNAFTLSGGDQGYTQSWSENSPVLGLELAVVTIPASYEPKTNFDGAKFTVGTSSDPAAVSSCLTPTNGEKAAGTVTINGTTFTKLTLGDAGAGNIYDTTSYRVLKNSQCYAVEYTIHSGNINNYDPSQGITAFNQANVQSALEGIVQSFKFLS